MGATVFGPPEGREKVAQGLHDSSSTLPGERGAHFLFHDHITGVTCF